MEDLTPELIARSAAHHMALQIVVAMLDEVRPGSRDQMINLLENAADGTDNDLIAAELTDLAEAL